MEPITLNKLFDIVELFIEHPTVSMHELETTLSISAKVTRERVRFLENVGFVVKDGTQISKSHHFEQFIDYWNVGNLEGMNRCLLQDPSYSDFLRFLEEQRYVRLSGGRNANGKRTRKFLADNEGTPLNEKKRDGQLGKKNFVPFDSFREWAIGFGIAHQSGSLVCWGGEDPSDDEFENLVFSSYANLETGYNGFVNIGQLADRICTKALISFVRFEDRFKSFYLKNRERIQLSGSSTREITIKPPLKIVRKRPLPSIEDYSGKRIYALEDRFETRYIEDGIWLLKEKVRYIKLK